MDEDVGMIVMVDMDDIMIENMKICMLQMEFWIWLEKDLIFFEVLDRW
jgi:hypothetical protein